MSTTQHSTPMITMDGHLYVSRNIVLDIAQQAALLGELLSGFQRVMDVVVPELEPFSDTTVHNTVLRLYSVSYGIRKISAELRDIESKVPRISRANFASGGDI